MFRFALAAAAATLACAPANAAPIININTPTLNTGTRFAQSAYFNVSTESLGGTPDIFDGSTVLIGPGSSLDAFYARPVAEGLDEVVLNQIIFNQSATGTLTVKWGLDTPGQVSGTKTFELGGFFDATIFDIPKAKFFSVTSSQPLEVRFLVFNAVPEPATWAMMIGGFGLVGAAMRRRTSYSPTVPPKAV